MPKLGVNIDHVATVRQARKTVEPDPIEAAALCEAAGCDSIVAHLREDRRHIQDRDIELLRRTVKTRLNLEMSINRDIVAAALEVRPDQATLVPEHRRELTTEGGLDVKGNRSAIRSAAQRLSRAGIDVSLFIDPEKGQIDAAKAIGVTMVELHTGNYADAKTRPAREKQRARLEQAAAYGIRLGLAVNAGHGLTYKNVIPVARIPGIEELNIGHSIISRAVMVGLDKAVREMRHLIYRLR